MIKSLVLSIVGVAEPHIVGNFEDRFGRSRQEMPTFCRMYSPDPSRVLLERPQRFLRRLGRINADRDQFKILPKTGSSILSSPRTKPSNCATHNPGQSE